MPAFQTDFVRNGGTYMVLTTAEGLQSHEFNRVQCGMIASTTIPHFLKLDVKEVDLHVSLNYDITGKRMLSQCMKGEKVSMLELYVLLLQIINALDECKQYMLQPSNYWLHEDYIFLDGTMNLGKIYLTYLPLKGDITEEPIQNRLLSIFMKLITTVTVLEGSGVQKIMQLCGSEFFSFASFRKLIRELLAGDDDLHTSPSPMLHRDLKSGSKPLEGIAYPNRIRNQQQDLSSLTYNGPSAKRIIHNPENSSEEWNPSEEIDQQGSRISSFRTYILLGAGLLAALVWKLLYLDSPGNLGLYISGGVTVAIAAGTAWLLLGRFSFLGSKRERSTPDDRDETITNEDGHTNRPTVSHDLQNKVQYESDTKQGKWNLDDFLRTNPTHPKSDLRDDEWDESKWRWNDQYLNTGTENKEASVYSSGSTGANISFTNKGDMGSDYVDRVLSPGEEAESGRGSYYEQLSGKTEILAPSRQATVLLGEREEQPANQPQNLYLERVEQGSDSVERVMLTGASFVIGRSADVVQYVEKAVGTSRAHIELTLHGGKCSIRDLGSRNGTKLKGAMIAPYKEYPLEIGESFSISSTNFKLCR